MIYEKQKRKNYFIYNGLCCVEHHLCVLQQSNSERERRKLVLLKYQMLKRCATAVSNLNLWFKNISLFLK